MITASTPPEAINSSPEVKVFNGLYFSSFAGTASDTATSSARLTLPEVRYAAWCWPMFPRPMSPKRTLVIAPSLFLHQDLPRRKCLERSNPGLAFGVGRANPDLISAPISGYQRRLAVQI